MKEILLRHCQHSVRLAPSRIVNPRHFFQLVVYAEQLSEESYVKKIAENETRDFLVVYKKQLSSMEIRNATAKPMVPARLYEFNYVF